MTKTYFDIAYDLIFANVRLLNYNDEPYFNIYDLGINFGLSRWNGKTYDKLGNKKESANKARIHKIIQESNIVPIVLEGSSYITYWEVFDFLFNTNTTNSYYICKLLSRYVIAKEFEKDTNKFNSRIGDK